MATIGAPEFLGQRDRAGSVEAGQDAALVILAGDPRANPAGLREPVSLLVRNRFYDQEALRRLRTAP
jgi:imidazolonepropionase-like amidohydrolase